MSKFGLKQCCPSPSTISLADTLVRAGNTPAADLGYTPVYAPSPFTGQITITYDDLVNYRYAEVVFANTNTDQTTPLIYVVNFPDVGDVANVANYQFYADLKRKYKINCIPINFILNTVYITLIGNVQLVITYQGGSTPPQTLANPLYLLSNPTTVTNVLPFTTIQTIRYEQEDDDAFKAYPAYCERYPHC